MATLGRKQENSADLGEQVRATHAPLDLLARDPFLKPPPFEKLVGDLAGAYSRRINVQHRLVYQVIEEQRCGPHLSPLARPTAPPGG